MRRFSQKNALVTLADINVTPLLDLAFVLLIIFVITTPLLEQSVPLDLPQGGRPEPLPLNRGDIKRIDVSPDGTYRLDGRGLSLAEIEGVLASEFSSNPRMVVAIAADRRAAWEAVAEVFDLCQRHGITRVNPLMAPER